VHSNHARLKIGAHQLFMHLGPLNSLTVTAHGRTAYCIHVHFQYENQWP